MREIEKSRFVRASVEMEVLRRAAKRCDADGSARMDANIEEQGNAIQARDVDGFGAVDYNFHKTLCDIAGVDFAFDVIMSEKAKIDRLCRLGLSKEQRLPDLMEDHKRIADAIKAHDKNQAVEVGMFHLSRLDETIERITATNANYF